MGWKQDFTVPEGQIGVTPDGSCSKILSGLGSGISDYQNLWGYTDFKGESYNYRCSFFEGKAPLPQFVGWFIVIGVGAMFAAFTSAIVYTTNRLLSKHETSMRNSEQYSSAGRHISTGFTAADIVSKWTWAATLLQSSNVAYKYGVSGPFWYAAGATIQVLLFAILAIQIKLKCPAIHTVLEVVFVRWGPVAHVVFLFFCLTTNLIVSAMLILGGSAVVSAVTGISTLASSFLIPLGVVGYTALGGLKGTYYAAYSHTAVIFFALLVMMWKVYVGPSELGSATQVYRNLHYADIKYPVEGNAAGSRLTMFSRSGIVFGIVNIVGNFGTVFVDQSYWQGAIACKPSAAYKGYLLGGLCWFAIPFCMATTLGLAGRALDLPVTLSESDQGLVPPAVALHLFGEAGAWLVTIQVFLAVTSSANSEQLAVASLFSYDVYKRYLVPHATGAQLIFISRAVVIFWAIFSGILSVALFELGIELSWVYMCMGILIGGAVAPITFSLTWRDCNAIGAVTGAIGGLLAGVTGWIVTAWILNDGLVNVNTMGQDYPMLCGNLLALFVSPAICAICSCCAPQGFVWEHLAKTTLAGLVEIDYNAMIKDDSSEDGLSSMQRAHRFSLWAASGLTIILIIAWPLLTLFQNPFSEGYFTWWVSLAFVWGHIAAFFTVIYPMWECRQEISRAFRIRNIMRLSGSAHGPKVRKQVVVIEKTLRTGQVVQTIQKIQSFQDQDLYPPMSDDPSIHGLSTAGILGGNLSRTTTHNSAEGFTRSISAV